nr:protein kinase-like domain, phloem protein 2-like protein [Tanacetum cinerariifolium]
MSVVVEKLEAALELKELHDLKLQREHEAEQKRKAAEYEEEQMRKAAEYEYREILELADPPLIYTSVKELKALLSKGLPVNGGKTLLSINDKGEVICFYINNYKTWFSLNEKGKHCEMLSIAHCLISHEGVYVDHTEVYPRFPSGIYRTNCKGFKVHIRTQLLTPSIRYTVNLVLGQGYTFGKQQYAGFRYKLVGETETSIVYLANETKDNRSFIAELYQFTSKGSIFDLEVVILDHDIDLAIEGILFQPLEKVEHEQVLEDVQLSNDSLQWTMKKDLFSNLLKWFNGQEGYAVDNNGKKSLMVSARGVIECDKGLSFKSSPESRFGEVAVINNTNFNIKKEFKSGVLSPQTTYATYLIYKLPQHDSQFKGFLQNVVLGGYGGYICLVSPPNTPIIGQKLDENTQNRLNRPKLNHFPGQRSDGWMEVKLGPHSINNDIMMWLSTPDYAGFCGLIIESIEIRPIEQAGFDENAKDEEEPIGEHVIEETEEEQQGDDQPKVISMMDIPIQQEVLVVQQETYHAVSVSFIPESTHVPPPPPQVTSAVLTSQVPNIEAVSSVVQRLTEMEEFVKELKEDDFGAIIHVSIQSQVLSIAKELQSWVQYQLGYAKKRIDKERSESLKNYPMEDLGNVA